MASCVWERHSFLPALRYLHMSKTLLLGRSHVIRRNASTDFSQASGPGSVLSIRIKLLFLGGTVATTCCFAYLYATDTRASAHRYIIPPLLRFLYPDAEDAHHAGISALKTLYSFGLHPRERDLQADDGLAVSVFGTTLANPIGISAGLDKDAEIPDPLFELGASVVEVGGITPLPQEGNPRPRIFRVPTVEGMVNRCGLNSRGADAVAARLRDRIRHVARQWGLSEKDVLELDVTDGLPPGSLRPGHLLLVQVAKNKVTDERDVCAVTRDYVQCVRRLAPYADVIVINVSSPNTPGLRDLQATEPLKRILGAVVEELRHCGRRSPPKVMVKVSPDEDDESQVEGVVQAVWDSGVDGVIVGNTTKRRAGLVPRNVWLSVREQRALMEEGGFSGPAMFERTLKLVKMYRKMLDGRGFGEEKTMIEPIALARAAEASTKREKMPDQKVIFATGGITNGEQALKMLDAGASVAMMYTGVVYGGSGAVTRIKGEMRKAIEDGSGKSQCRIKCPQE